jgi:flagellar protein FliT
VNDTETMLEHYESIAAATQAMLDAARRSDWDALHAAEAECARRIERLKRLQAATGAETAFDAAARRRRHALLCRMLAHDAEIRALTQPWLAKLEAFLGRGPARGRTRH